MKNVTNFYQHSDNSICSVYLSTTRWELDGSVLTWGGDWAAGEPNNYHNKENCVVFAEVSKGKFTTTLLFSSEYPRCRVNQ